MTYAILKHGGHQYRVAAGDRLLVDRLSADVGSTVTLEPVLFVANGANSEIGAGAVAGARVIATVVAHRRGRKLRVFTFKPKKRHRRTLGYRSQLTELRIVEVAAGAAKPARATGAKRGAATRVPAAATEATPAATTETAPDAVSDHEPEAVTDVTPRATRAKRSTAAAPRSRSSSAPRSTPRRAKKADDGA